MHRQQTTKTGNIVFHEKQLSADQLATARKLRGEGWAWDRIASALLVTAYAIRCEIEPGYRDYKKRYARRQWEETPTRKRSACDHRVADDRAPEDVLRQRAERQIALERRTASQTILGDPPQGYSALDQRTRGRT
jgi:hypothetical protein